MKFTGHPIIPISARNVVLVGAANMGLEKSHVVTALGLRACGCGHSVLFTSAIDAVNTLVAAKAAGQLKRDLAPYRELDECPELTAMADDLLLDTRLTPLPRPNMTVASQRGRICRKARLTTRSTGKSRIT